MRACYKSPSIAAKSVVLITTVTAAGDGNMQVVCQLVINADGRICTLISTDFSHIRKTTSTMVHTHLLGI